MFERPTRKARKTTVLAREEAGRFAHGYIGTKLMNEGVAGRILSTPGVGPNEVGRPPVALALPGGWSSDKRRLLHRGQLLTFEVGVRLGSSVETVVPRGSDRGRSPGVRPSRALKR